MSWAMRARVRNARSDAPAEQLRGKVAEILHAANADGCRGMPAPKECPARGMVSTDRILADPDGTRTGPPRSHMAATQLIQRTHLIATQSRGKFRSVQTEEVRAWRASRSAISMTG